MNRKGRSNLPPPLIPPPHPVPEVCAPQGWKTETLPPSFPLAYSSPEKNAWRGPRLEGLRRKQCGAGQWTQTWRVKINIIVIFYSKSNELKILKKVSYSEVNPTMEGFLIESTGEFKVNFNLTIRC